MASLCLKMRVMKVWVEEVYFSAHSGGGALGKTYTIGCQRKRMNGYMYMMLHKHTPRSPNGDRPYLFSHRCLFVCHRHIMLSLRMPIIGFLLLPTFYVEQIMNADDEPPKITHITCTLHHTPQRPRQGASLAQYEDEEKLR